MKWSLKEMQPSDMVRVPSGGFYHYGICVDEDTIIQFGESVVNPLVDPNTVEVNATTVDKPIDVAIQTANCLNICPVGKIPLRRLSLTQGHQSVERATIFFIITVSILQTSAFLTTTQAHSLMTLEEKWQSSFH